MFVFYLALAALVAAAYVLGAAGSGVTPSAPPLEERLRAPLAGLDLERLGLLLSGLALLVVTAWAGAGKRAPDERTDAPADLWHNRRAELLLLCQALLALVFFLFATLGVWQLWSLAAIGAFAAAAAVQSAGAWLFTILALAKRERSRALFWSGLGVNLVVLLAGGLLTAATLMLKQGD